MTGGRVLLFSLEEFVGDVAQRLVRFGADPANVYIVDSLVSPIADFEALVRRIRPALVVLDTLTAFADLMPTGTPDAGDAGAWTSIMMALGRPCRETGAALLVLHHARKSDGEYRDSTAIGASVDMILTMSEGKDGDTRRVKAKGRFYVEDYTFAMVGDSLQLADAELSVEARVLTHVINHPGDGMKNVREAIGARAADVDDAIRMLLKTDSVHDHGTANRHAYYAPPACPKGCPGSSEHQPEIGGEVSGAAA